VRDRTVEVINHQLEDRFDLFFSVSRIVSKGGILEFVSSVLGTANRSDIPKGHAQG
jgi:hypothetical protein